VTAVPSPRTQLVELSADDLRARLYEAVGLYVTAMRYPRGTEEQRAPMWLAHMAREGWRCVAAIDQDDRLVGICYGYLGTPSQWWHEQVRRGITQLHGPLAADEWLGNYFELTELHVHPDSQGRGTGEVLLRRLVSEVRTSRVLLSTPEGRTRAWRLYRRLGFRDVLRDYKFTGDPRPFAVLGRTLPLTDE
jgi:ribosomal protein S18 acetylase RimI-like enzyme